MMSGKILAFWDLQTCPCNYDFLTFAVIVQSKAHRLNKGAHIIFVPRADKSNKKQYSLNEQDFRLNHILVPAAYSLGLTYTLCRSREEAKDMYFDEAEHMVYNKNTFFPNYYDEWLNNDVMGTDPFKTPPKGLDRNTSLCHILEQYKKAKLFWPQPTKHALDLVKREFPERPFVITLRECYRESRNSNLEEWLNFADSIYDDFDPVFVRDTAKWNESLRDLGGSIYDTFPLASIDFDIRLALYHWARQNFTVGGGAISLLQYSDLPYRCFKMAPEKHGSASPQFLESMGFPEGSQFPWRTGNQKIIWEDDTFENLKAEYDELETN